MVIILGVNPFHFALDKAYGTSDKFKEFIDTCHQNGFRYCS
jgi:1,4-alpha-glucan branching enzyme